ncbi:MAG: hypothetical protein AAFX87_08605 [Bacteroidota bacterium]
MTKTIIIGLLLTFGFTTYGQNHPFRDTESYEFSVDYYFIKPLREYNDRIDFEGQKQKSRNQLLSMNIKVSVLSLVGEEYKVWVTNNKHERVMVRKLEAPMDFVIKMGAVEEMKTKRSPHLYFVYFKNKKKDTLSKLTFEVRGDGSFMVNNEMYGRL